MSNEDLTNPGTGSFEAEASNAEVSRIITATIRSEEFYKSLKLPGKTAEQRAEILSTMMLSAGDLQNLAQNYDFMGTEPDLAGTDSKHNIGKRLVAELQREDIPAGIRDVYSELYAQDLAAYTSP